MDTPLGPKFINLGGGSVVGIERSTARQGCLELHVVCACMAEPPLLSGTFLPGGFLCQFCLMCVSEDVA